MDLNWFILGVATGIFVGRIMSLYFKEWLDRGRGFGGFLDELEK